MLVDQTSYLIAHAHSAGPCCGVAGVVVVRGGGVDLWLVLSLSLSLSPVAVAVVGTFFLERPPGVDRSIHSWAPDKLSLSKPLISLQLFTDMTFWILLEPPSIP